MQSSTDAKKFDDYLPGETRKQYVKRRALGLRHLSGICWRFHKGTLAKPGTQEYKRFQNVLEIAEHGEQYPGHLKAIDKIYAKAA